MALVSQVIKNLKGGISQQPNILRYPEQGSAQINGWSSETEGLQKRPPIVYQKAIATAGAFGPAPFVHQINRDENEQYYAIFTGSSIRVFDLQGNEYAVRGAMDYVTVDNPRDDLRMVTIADYTFVVNRKTVVSKGATKSTGGTFDPKKSALINVRGGQYGRTLSVEVNGAQVSLQIANGGTVTDITQTDAQWIAENLAGKLRGVLGGWDIRVGQGYIYIGAPNGSAINTLSTKDGYADQLINPVTHYAQTFSKLPLNAPDGYLVEIVGDTSKTADRYYVIYDGSRKVWKETVGWNTLLDFNDTTMPHALVRAEDGNFDFKVLEWGDRTSGDEDTNPFPSFTGKTLNDVFFFRNRLGFLSGENIILSRTARYFNFFPASVANLSDDDPIDVAVSFNRVSILKYAVPFTEELLLWSDEAQFVLTANGVLSSKSVELNLTTQFDVQEKSRPFGIGRNVYFASPRASFTSINRYYAVQDVSSVKNAEDITAHVPSYIPNGVFDIHGSATENFASVLTSGAESRIYLYKFLYLNEELRQQSWSHWEFGEGTRVLAASSIGSTMSVVLENAYNVWIGYIEFIKHSKDIGDEPYRLFIDNKIRYVIPAGSYNDDEYITSINLETIYGMKYRMGTVYVVEADGKVNKFDTPDGRYGWHSDPILRLNGNLEGATVFIGFNIPFRYDFSKFLIKQNADDGSSTTEDTGRLQLRRAWVNYEDSGAFTVGVKSVSSEFFYEMSGGRMGDSALAAGALNLGTGQFRFPVPGNAKHIDVSITANNTVPLNVIGCGWEGNYIRRSSGI